MATTVTYNGNILTTVDNQTRTLLTSGKYMEDDLTLTDISGSGSSANKKQINFIDYDGTLLHSYTKTEWQSVSALPSNPSHTGLTAQGWNWTKAQIDAQLVSAPDGDIWVGQMYITDDGKTRIYVHLENGRLHPYLGICLNGTVTVDWGDGSAIATLTGTSLTTIQHADHIYTSSGDYIITLTVLNGSFSFSGTSDLSYLLKKDASTTKGIHDVYSHAVQKIEIGSSASIGDYAFYACYALASVTIPESITNIGSSAFTNCYALISIVIPSGITSIKANTFTYCNSLMSIAIPSSVTSIGSMAFSRSCSLTSITIPNMVRSIDSYAFSYCVSLRFLIIPSGVTAINPHTFFDCEALTSIVLPDSVTNIGDYAFTQCYALTSVTIPNSVIRIGDYAFQSCSTLASVTMPNSISSIGDYVFAYCNSLTSIAIPSSVTSIGIDAFYYCLSLATIVIPSGVISIGAAAFCDCRGIAEYHILSTTPPTLANSNVFTRLASDCVIYVPLASLETYQTASNWSTYASYIQGE